ncbi:lipase secretion chaperone [Chitinivorax sp. B]|uniref:lipase secretion chaperone n=1 Tax=Chitinivorax sp. B TaxID=2502235 RepID=UPI001484DC07|nr:lipase secretion chaperone [Chitinivorax sp. B]
MAALVSAGAVAGLLFHTDSIGAPEMPIGQQVAREKPFAPSLRGTNVDGQIQQGQGELVIGPALLQRFDYYLATYGERPLPDIRQAIERDLDKSLKPEHATRAKAILARYLDFKAALATLAKQAIGHDDELTLAGTRTRLAAIKQLRDRFFSPRESEALFGEDDVINDLSLTRLEVTHNPQLSPAEKAGKLAEIESQLPATQRTAQAAAVSHAVLADKVAAARNQGASDAQIFALRSVEVGPEAATRLAAVDQEEAEWKQRITAYLAERGQILASSLADADKQAAILQAQHRRFNEMERLRLAAYE